jgi:hypothetical protein
LIGSVEGTDTVTHTHIHAQAEKDTQTQANTHRVTVLPVMRLVIAVTVPNSDGSGE